MTAITTGHTQLLAMHGWAGDHRAWRPWGELAAQRGWAFGWGERGYGQLPPQLPAWDPGAERRILLVHSLGLHLLPAPLLAQASALVLLATFSAFVPPGRAGRAVRTALRGMQEQLERGDDATLLRAFCQRAAAPLSATQLPSGPLEQGISPEGHQRLLADLELLAGTSGLPEGFPLDRAVLLVEAADDQIVVEPSRALLREALPHASLWTLNAAGHCLLVADLPERVMAWIGDERA